jgi:hypothetical protein
MTYLGTIRGSAVFSACEHYRYRLDRALDGKGPPVGFMLHNPSLAGADREDATSRRGIGYARRWGAASLIFLNPFARISTSPGELWKASPPSQASMSPPDPVGPENDRHIRQACAELAAGGGLLVYAFGVFGRNQAERLAIDARRREVMAIVAATGVETKALALAADGVTPKHPLRLRADLIPFRWPAATAAEEETSHA